MKRYCKGCGRDISHRHPQAGYCERRQCYANDRNRQRLDRETRDAAGALALRVVANGMRATVTHTKLHGWCVKATLPHGPEVYFTDEEDLAFYLAEGAVAA
jgi:uncharacterized paraquat-inducible protein A